MKNTSIQFPTPISERFIKDNHAYMTCKGDKPPRAYEGNHKGATTMERQQTHAEWKEIQEYWNSDFFINEVNPILEAIGQVSCSRCTAATSNKGGVCDCCLREDAPEW